MVAQRGPGGGSVDVVLLGNATETLHQAIWAMLRQDADLQAIAEALFKRNWTAVNAANVRRTLRTVRRNVRLDVQESLVTTLVAKFNHSFANSLVLESARAEELPSAADGSYDAAEVNSLAVVRRSILLLSLFVSLWKKEARRRAKPLTPDKWASDDNTTDDMTPTDKINWDTIVDLLSWSAEADILVDADHIYQQTLDRIIDVEKRAYALCACKGNSEVFHDAVAHAEISRNTMLLFIYGFWDHALSLIDRCFAYGDEAYGEFMAMLNYRFPKQRYSWRDVGEPTHPLRDPQGLAAFRQDIGKAFIVENKLRMSDQHLLKPMVVLLGWDSTTKPWNEADDSIDNNDFNPPDDTAIIVSANAVNDSVGDLLKTVFAPELPDSLGADDTSRTDDKGGNKLSPVSWFIASLVWNLERLQPLLVDDSMVDQNAVGCIFQRWWHQKQLENEFMPVADVAFSLVLGNDVDHLLEMLAEHRHLYLPQVPTLIALLVYLEFPLTASDLTSCLLKSCSYIAWLAHAYSATQMPEGACRWSYSLEKQAVTWTAPLTMLIAIMTTTAPEGDFDSTALLHSAAWWIDEGRFGKVADPLEYVTKRAVVDTVLFSAPELCCGIKLEWVKQLLQQRDLRSSMFPYYELQAIINSMSDVDTQGDDESPMVQWRVWAEEPTNLIKSYLENIGPLQEDHPLVVGMMDQPSMIEKALFVSMAKHVHPLLREASLLALLAKGARLLDTSSPDLQPALRHIVSSAYELLLYVSEHGLELNSERIWYLMNAVTERTILSQEIVDRLLSSYHVMLKPHPPSPLKCLMVRSVRNLILNAVSES